jgi:predicted PurR-regulated permease PerM
MIFVNLAAALALLYFGADIFLPIAMALVITTVLRPVVRRMEVWKIPTPAGAAAVVLSGLALLWVIGYQLTPAIAGFVKTLPDVAVSAGAKLKTLPRPLDQLGVTISAAAAEMEKPQESLDSAAIARKAARARTQAAAVPTPGGLSGAVPIIGEVFGTAAGMVSSFMATLLLVLFFLSSGDQVRRRLMKHAASSTLSHSIVEIGDELQSVVAHYLTLLTLINMGQGIAVTIVMELIGMPVPLVWGAMSFVAEFFPYLGSAVMIILLTLVGLAAPGGGVGHVVLAPLAYVGVTMIQGSVISPITYGRFLKLSPPAILVSVMVWWLIWGMLGAFLAVPILALVRIVCDRQKGKLMALGAFIEG